MGESKFQIGMRDAFFEALFPLFEADRNRILITADNGAPSLDRFSSKLPEQFINVGIAEALLVGMASGMAFEGKRVYAYAIAPFLTSRCYEQNKLDLAAMSLPVVLVGVGAGYAYDIMGPSHHTVDDITLMRALPNMAVYSPADGFCAASLARLTSRAEGPVYIRFDRAGIPNLYEGLETAAFAPGCLKPRSGDDLIILATGVMVHQALLVADRLAQKGISCGVVDIFRLKPLNQSLLLDWIGTRPTVTLEEHLLAGGLGSLIAELFCDEGVPAKLLRLGQRDRFVFDYGGRSVIWEKHGLDAASIEKEILRWLKKGVTRPPRRGATSALSLGSAPHGH